MFLTRTKILISTIFFLCHILLYAQYVNPHYGGANSSGFGESGAQLAGPLGGVLNPASLYIHQPRANISITTGIFSDYLLFYPTLKDLSISYPIVRQMLAVRLFYGIPKDNNLRQYPHRNIWSKYDGSYSGGQRRLGGSIVYRMPLSRWFKSRNYFDVRVGFGLSRFWGGISSWSSQPKHDSYWIDNYQSSGSGLGIKLGTLIKIRYSPKYNFIFSSVFQGSLMGGGIQKRRVDFYNLGLGLKYYLFKGSSKSIQTGIELENPVGFNQKKYAFGIRYNFTEEMLNSVQGGFFIYPRNIYHGDPQYTRASLFWYSIGFTKTIHNWIISCSLSDAVNLDLKHSSDIAKIFSLSLSLPLDNRIAPHIQRSINASPEFIDLSFHKRKLLIGREDTLSFYIHHLGRDSIKAPKIFFNIEPKTGIILPKPFVDASNLINMSFIEVKVPLKSIPSIPANTYLLTARLTYGHENTLVKQFEIETTEPILEVSPAFSKNRRFWFFEVPGSYILELNIVNHGTHTSDSLYVFLPDDYVVNGLVEKKIYYVGKIKPNTVKKVRITFNTPRDDLPLIMPITINFKEKNGFDPLPIHADFIMWSQSQVSLSELKKDPFLNSFVQYHQFYAVLNLGWEELKQLGRESTLIPVENPNFPGKVVIGPYDNITDALAIRYTLDIITEDYEFVAIQGRTIIPVKRHFYLIEKSADNLQILKELGKLPYYSDMQQSSKLLIGPFSNIMAVDKLELLVQEFFTHYEVVTRYPTQVTFGGNKKKRVGITSLKDGLND